jgi:hypothetical protein
MHVDGSKSINSDDDADDDAGDYDPRTLASLTDPTAGGGGGVESGYGAWVESNCAPPPPSTTLVLTIAGIGARIDAIQ